jgi:hypothetical protein
LITIEIIDQDPTAYYPSILPPFFIFSWKTVDFMTDKEMKEKNLCNLNLRFWLGDET